MNSSNMDLNTIDLIDLYYPTDETIAALLAVPPEQREALLRRILADASEAGKDTHISRVLAMIDVLADRARSWKSDN
jgi:hypothetical protein